MRPPELMHSPRVAGWLMLWSVWDEIEADVSARYQAIAVENDAVVAPGAGNLGAVPGCRNAAAPASLAAQLSLRLVSAQMNQPQSHSRWGLGAVQPLVLVVIFCMMMCATAFDGFGAGKLQAGFRGCFPPVAPASALSVAESWAAQWPVSTPSTAHGDHEFNQGKTQASGVDGGAGCGAWRVLRGQEGVGGRWVALPLPGKCWISPLTLMQARVALAAFSSLLAGSSKKSKAVGTPPSLSETMPQRSRCRVVLPVVTLTLFSADVSCRVSLPLFTAQPLAQSALSVALIVTPPPRLMASERASVDG